jgi:hypothetical protein
MGSFGSCSVGRSFLFADFLCLCYVKSFREQYHTNLTAVNWKVNVAAGQSIMFGIEDNKGHWDWTDDVRYIVYAEAFGVPHVWKQFY